MRPFASLILFSVLVAAGAAEPPGTAPPPPATKGLTVSVLQGENVIHSLPNPPASHIAVQVSDGAGKLIHHAVVVFELPEDGAGAHLHDGTLVKTVLTDPAGNAAIQIESNSVPGTFQPRITVNYLGQTTHITLRQENAFGAQVRPSVYRQTLLGKTTPKHQPRISKRALLILVAIAAGATVAAFTVGHGSTTPGSVTPGNGSVTPGNGSVTAGSGTVTGGN